MQGLSNTGGYSNVLSVYWTSLALNKMRGMDGVITGSIVKMKQGAMWAKFLSAGEQEAINISNDNNNLVDFKV